MKSDIKKVVLAYSGGLDTSVIVPWLKENYECEVIAFAADIGQEEELDTVRERALETGASKVYIDDLKDEFVKEFIFPTLRAGAVYEGKYLLGTSFARPLIAKRQIEIAFKEGADAVSHGATGKGNDQVRFELSYMALNPDIKVIAPWKDDRWQIASREDALKYAAEKGINIPFKKEKVYSEDRNAFHISHEGCDLEDPWNEPESKLWTVSCPLEEALEKPEYVEIDYEKGMPLAVNGKKMTPYKLLKSLNEIGKVHAIGQVDMVENRLVGLKSRGVYETPGGTILFEAHRHLERLVLDRETYHYKELVALRYSELVYNGQWFTPLKEAIDGFVDSTQKVVSGKVRLKLYKGNVIYAGTKSPNSLYSEELSSFDKDKLYNQKDAIGFIKLYGLPVKTQALLKRKKK